MTYLHSVNVNTNNATGDAFSRLRVSTPEYVFDTNFQYNLQPLVYEQITNGSGATVTHDSTNRHALLTFSSTPTGGKSYLQTYEWFRYQAGRSQMVIQTFNFIETATDCLKFVGYGDGTDGIELQQSGSTIQLVRYSSTAVGNQTVAKADWNIDPMNGNGVSGINLDFTKTQIFVVDLQWLGVGRVRCGFDVNGVLYWCHEFYHANLKTHAYMRTANLPLRIGMTCTGTVSTTMRYICASVTSEGGQPDPQGYEFALPVAGTAGSDARAHILSLRPKTTFNSIANRAKFVLLGLDVMVTGSNPVLVEVVIGQAISGTTTYSDVNATYSGFEYNTAGTISGSPAIVMSSAYIPASNQTKGAYSRGLSAKYPITLDAAGAVRALGTVSLIATGFSGTSAIKAALTWKEVR